MKKRVLIVDDDPRNIFALKAVLRSRGFDCLTAPSAAEGLELLQNPGGVHVVLMDMMMPDMDGYEAISRIRADQSLSALPVIAVTAQAMTGDREKCLAAGADDYISKPIDTDRLIAVLNKY